MVYPLHQNIELCFCALHERSLVTRVSRYCPSPAGTCDALQPRHSLRSLLGDVPILRTENSPIATATRPIDTKWHTTKRGVLDETINDKLTTNVGRPRCDRSGARGRFTGRRRCHQEWGVHRDLG